jgi:hypothetical protein
MAAGFCDRCGHPRDSGATACPQCHAVLACANCGSSLPLRAHNCPSCGARVLDLRKISRRGRVLRASAVGFAALVIVLLALASGPRLAPLALSEAHTLPPPPPTRILTSGGVWGVDGFPSSTTEISQCQDCGQGYVSPGAVLTIHVQFVFPYAVCHGDEGNFACTSFNVSAVQVGAPYTLLSTSQGALPVQICGGGEYVWSLTIQAPSTPGDFPINGGIQGNSVGQFFSPTSPTCVLHN